MRCHKGKRMYSSENGLIFIISGPSGSGKTTLLKRLLKDRQLKNTLTRSVSFTTRPKRIGEKEGQDYFFISREEFRRLRRAQKILEWTEYLGYYYATPKEFVETQLSRGRNILMCLDVKGALSLKKLYPQRTVTIFILPPDIKTLRLRINQRSQKTKESQIKRRIALAEKEWSYSSRYDYCLVNDRLEKVVDRLKKLILERISLVR
ncbi:MAG: guanylate kinase [Candidatus Omnitrophica bacterium]|nr:guanylate kinase [Candidatus Omnitrophota bacterium]